MRITRESLLKLARNTVDLRTRQNRRLMCVYLTGSLLNDEPLLGGTTDIDLVFVHNSEPPVQREVERISDEVHLDISNYSQSVFSHPRQLRADPWLGGYLGENPIVLYDTQHWFEFTQASVFSGFYQAENILQRCLPLAETARQHWLDLHSGSIPNGPQQIRTYLKALEAAANAIACLNGVPLTERRMVLHLPQRTQAIQRPNLMGEWLNLFMHNNFPSQDWPEWQENWKSALMAIGTLDLCPIKLKACRQAYYIRSASTLWETNPAAAIWIMLRTWTLAQCTETESTLPEGWHALCRAMLLDGSHLEGRLDMLDTFLDHVEECLEEWGKQNGVDMPV